MLFRGFLFGALALNLQAQALAPDDQLQEVSPASEVAHQPRPTGAPLNPFSVLRMGNFSSMPTPFADPVKYGLLDDSQKAKLGAIVEKIWMHPPTPGLAMVLDLTSAYLWPRHSCPRETGAASDLYLTSSQLSQIQEQRQSVGPWRERTRAMPLNSLIKSVSELPTLREQAAKRRDQALAVLNDAQKAQLAAFEAALQLLSEAREFRLTPLLGGDEAMCQ